VPNLDPEEPTVAIAVFGQQVQDFLQSDIGDYLLKKAAQQEEAAVEAVLQCVLKGTPPPEAVVMQLAHARKFQEWLGQAVENGLQALALMKEDANE
jgi:hypothetical protein